VGTEHNLALKARYEDDVQVTDKATQWSTQRQVYVTEISTAPAAPPPD